MISDEQAQGKIRAGWLRIWMGFDALAIKEETAANALNELLEKFDSDERVKVYKKEILQSQKVESPVKGFDEAFSQGAKIEFVVKNLDNLIDIVIEYGPSGLEILEPKEIRLNVAEAQAVINSVAAMMHRFAASGLGGAILVRGKGESE